jgi:N6-adenosine-specific RNA methylase IME4/ParB-like chromosome segregation protein Spo0J
MVLTLKPTVTSAPSLEAVHAILPMHSTEEYEALREDINRNGQMMPILMKGEQVIDGRARLKICKELGITPIIDDLGEAANDADWAISTNLYRRHLTTGQRAMFAELLAPLQKGANQHTATAACTRKEAAKLMGVSEDSIDRIRKIKAGGSSKLVDMVSKGRVSLDAAAKLVKSYADTQEQDEILVRGIERVKKDQKKRDVLDVKRAVAQKLGENNVAALETLSGKYSVIYADPPWDYGGSTEGSFCDPTIWYPLMSTKSIMDLPVKDCLVDDAVLYLWVPSCLLEDGLAVLKAWGFKYVSSMVWCKNRAVMSLGPTKTAHEMLLIGRFGTAMHELDARMNSWITADATEHSKKPEIFATMLDEMYPGLPKLEMFARQPRGETWSVFGNQVVGEAGETSNAQLVDQPEPTAKIAKGAKSVATVKSVKAKVLSEIFEANDPRSRLAA